MTQQSVELTSAEELAAVYGEPTARARDKAVGALQPIHRDWLAHSPFCVLSTSAADGSCDASPKGDPPGFTRVIDDRTIAIPDRPGNRRVDGFANVLSNPHVGLLYLIPGRGDTLRINGTARLLRDAPYFDDLLVRGHRPALALEVHVEQVYFHCAKAFLRSGLWKPETWEPTSVPSRAQIAKQYERRDESIAELNRYYQPEEYAKRLY